VEYEPKHREVYHDHNNCPDGKRIKDEHREQATSRAAKNASSSVKPFAFEM
jgi:hypothetical protein